MVFLFGKHASNAMFICAMCAIVQHSSLSYDIDVVARPLA